MEKRHIGSPHYGIAAPRSDYDEMMAIMGSSPATVVPTPLTGRERHDRKEQMKRKLAQFAHLYGAETGFRMFMENASAEIQRDLIEGFMMNATMPTPAPDPSLNPWERQRKFRVVLTVEVDALGEGDVKRKIAETFGSKAVIAMIEPALDPTSNTNTTGSAK